MIYSKKTEIIRSKMFKKYICTKKGSDETINCKTCGGATNFCGKYNPKCGENPFEMVYKESREFPLDDRGSWLRDRLSKGKGL